MGFNYRNYTNLLTYIFQQRHIHPAFKIFTLRRSPSPMSTDHFTRSSGHHTSQVCVTCILLSFLTSVHFPVAFSITGEYLVVYRGRT